MNKPLKLFLFLFEKKFPFKISFQMVENIVFEIATLQDIDSILRLQELYLVSNLSQRHLPLIN
jgi:hypothetical protein